MVFKRSPVFQLPLRGTKGDENLRSGHLFVFSKFREAFNRAQDRLPDCPASFPVVLFQQEGAASLAARPTELRPTDLN
jgi:hypothetical protein